MNGGIKHNEKKDSADGVGDQIIKTDDLTIGWKIQTQNE